MIIWKARRRWEDNIKIKLREMNGIGSGACPLASLVLAALKLQLHTCTHAHTQHM